MRETEMIYSGIGLLVLSLLVWWTATSMSLGGYQDDLRSFDDAVGEIAGVELALEVSVSSEERRLGLSYLPRLDPETGMLFVYEAPHTPRFWMKGMQFPIDILWLNEDMVVVDISERVSPDSYTSSSVNQTFSPAEPVQYVLEVVSDFARTHGIKKGDTFSITQGTLEDEEE